MKAEVLYVPGCRHHPDAVTKLREVLSAERIAAEIQEILVTDTKTVENSNSAVLRQFGSRGETLPGKRRDGNPSRWPAACILVQEGQAFRRRR